MPNIVIISMSRNMHSKLTVTDHTYVHSYGKILFFDIHLKSRDFDHSEKLRITDVRVVVEFFYPKQSQR